MLIIIANLSKKKDIFEEILDNENNEIMKDLTEMNEEKLIN
jgi:hypothetical protein